MRDSYIYYIRDVGAGIVMGPAPGPIIATVALVKSGHGTWCRGVAIVGKNDTGCRRIGRQIAMGRAEKAARLMYSAQPYHRVSRKVNARRELVDWKMQEIRELFHDDIKSKTNRLYRAMWDARLTEFEKKLTTPPTNYN